MKIKVRRGGCEIVNTPEVVGPEPGRVVGRVAGLGIFLSAVYTWHLRLPQLSPD